MRLRLTFMMWFGLRVSSVGVIDQLTHHPFQTPPFISLSCFLLFANSFSLLKNSRIHPSPKASDTGNSWQLYTITRGWEHLLLVASAKQNLKLKVQQRSSSSYCSVLSFSVLKLPVFSWTNIRLQGNGMSCPFPSHILKRCICGVFGLFYFHFVGDLTLIGTQHTSVCLVCSFAFKAILIHYHSDLYHSNYICQFPNFQNSLCFFSNNPMMIITSNFNMIFHL